MSIDDITKEQLAKELFNATRNKCSLSCITIVYPDLTVSEAYQIQHQGMLLRLEKREKTVGFKMGLTSKEKQKQMGVDTPICGVLTDVMQLPCAEYCNIQQFIQPKVEPEIAFIIDREIKGNVTPIEALAACGGVCAALDVIDSRFYHFQFKLPDVIADNCSSGGFVLSKRIQNPKQLDLENLKMTFYVNGQVVSVGRSSATLGSPVNALAFLANLLWQEKKVIPAGSIVLCGGAMAAINLTSNMHVILQVDQLDSVELIIP